MPNKPACQCNEMKFEDKKGRIHQASSSNFSEAKHNCNHVESRNSLIDTASEYADRQVPEANKEGAPKIAHDKWTRAFADKMNELSEPLLKQELFVTQRAASMAHMSDTYFLQLASLNPVERGYLPAGSKTMLWTKGQIAAIERRKKR